MTRSKPNSDRTELESDGTTGALDDRDIRALTEYLTVLPETGRAKNAEDLYLVVSQSGNEYLVDARTGACECSDHQYRGVKCKHLRRVAYATGSKPVPAWMDTDAVDSHLGEHVTATPRVAATDGGTSIIDAGDDAEILDGDNENGDDRPEDCQCWNADEELACWPCYRAGFRTQNPDEPAADD